MSRWNVGLGHDNTRIIMPKCGITWGDIWRIKTEVVSARQAAKRLGVDYQSLLDALDRAGLAGFFGDGRKQRTVRPEQTKITRRKIIYYARHGMTKRDAAAEIGVSADWFSRRVTAEGLGYLYPTRGKSGSITRRGYAQ